MGRILAISSHVARGHVGLAATQPAMQRLGHEVWALPTVLLASRPGLGVLAKFDIPHPDLSAMLAAHEADGCWSKLDGVFTGYFPSPQSVEVAAKAISNIKLRKSQITVLVDPILGDDGCLYVAPDTAAAIRDKLLPLATIVTPNLFELAWLTGMSDLPSGGLVDAARRLGVPMVVVTSASSTQEHITTFLVTKANIIERKMRVHDGIPNGAGDLFAGLFLGHMLNGHPTESALDCSLTELDMVLAESTHSSVLKLSALWTRSS